jgi:CRISPR-associated protein Cas1
MQTLYVSQQGCYISLQKEHLLVKRKETIQAEVQLPHLEQILLFGKSQITTQAIQACLKRNIPIAFLSRMGYCYGRLFSLERGYRHLSRYQQQMSSEQRFKVAQKIVQAKLKNSRIFLMRQQRRHPNSIVELAIKSLSYFIEKAKIVNKTEQLMGLEGAGATQYFTAFGEIINQPDFPFINRTRRPPTNPVNAMLSFGYQVLWNHLLSLIELQGLDPYQACLHQGTERHAALASDLIEEFRVPLIDSLVLWLINSKVMDATEDFTYRTGGCYLNNSGRKKYLHHWILRMEEKVKTLSGQMPRWDLLNQQVKLFKQFIYHPEQLYKPYEIR